MDLKNPFLINMFLHLWLLNIILKYWFKNVLTINIFCALVRPIQLKTVSVEQLEQFLLLYIVSFHKNVISFAGIQLKIIFNWLQSLIEQIRWNRKLNYFLSWSVIILRSELNNESFYKNIECGFGFSLIRNLTKSSL